MAKKQNTFVYNRVQEATALFLCLLTIYLLLAFFTHNPNDPSFNVSTPAAVLHNKAGLMGAYLSDVFIQYFGLASFLVPAFLSVHAFHLFRHEHPDDLSLRLSMLPLIMLSAAALFYMLSPLPTWPSINSIGNGGLLGKLLVVLVAPYVGNTGAALLFTAIFFLCTLWWSGLNLRDVSRLSLKAYNTLRMWGTTAARLMKRMRFKNTLQIDLPLTVPHAPRRAAATHVPSVIEKAVSTPKPAPREEMERQSDLPLNLGGDFTLPPLHLLDKPSETVDKESDEALQQNARRIEAELANFGITGKVTKICPGPVITIYELEPAAGVKTSQVVGLSDDLARAMSALSIRIAPIPGRNVIGIEMPNRKRQTVTLRQLLATEAFETHPGKLTVAVGVDTAGQPSYADVSKMPHALIAGTTGSGKSVAMNAFIISLLYRMTPEQLRFVMIDPKMLELSVYNDIPHLLTPVIIDPNKASNALKWVVKEMENRYKMMTDMGVKNIQSFNQKFADMQARDEIPMRKVQTGFDPVNGQPTFEEQPLAKAQMPYIVVVIDELADLMMVAGKEVEHSIARIAQMARAAGIHLLVATQRPSVDVVTGLIKANIPTRYSFNVTSKIDSRTILDQMGAEQLLGRGDMLQMANGANALERLHGAFVSEEECLAIAQFLKEQGSVADTIDITRENAGASGAGGGGAGGDIADDDPLYLQAIEIVASEQKASTSFIQRHLKIGYNRAASIIEKMEQDGLVGAANHVGKREVIIKQPPQAGY